MLLLHLILINLLNLPALIIIVIVILSILILRKALGSIVILIILKQFLIRFTTPLNKD